MLLENTHDFLRNASKLQSFLCTSIDRVNVLVVSRNSNKDFMTCSIKKDFSELSNAVALTLLFRYLLQRSQF